MELLFGIAAICFLVAIGLTIFGGVQMAKERGQMTPEQRAAHDEKIRQVVAQTSSKVGDAIEKWNDERRYIRAAKLARSHAFWNTAGKIVDRLK